MKKPTAGGRHEGNPLLNANPNPPTALGVNKEQDMRVVLGILMVVGGIALGVYVGI
ncbi:hypothetical protein HYT45_00385 [Candidatus Uhrbacteria bacterium]|nr:hypothetical protein [Candidatus Uhrbacteria bacterium]